MGHREQNIWSANVVSWNFLPTQPNPSNISTCYHGNFSYVMKNLSPLSKIRSIKYCFLALWKTNEKYSICLKCYNDSIVLQTKRMQRFFLWTPLKIILSTLKHYYTFNLSLKIEWMQKMKNKSKIIKKNNVHVRYALTHCSSFTKSYKIHFLCNIAYIRRGVCNFCIGTRWHPLRNHKIFHLQKVNVFNI